MKQTSVTWLTHKTAPGLPPFCAYQLPSDGSTILLRRGMRCYYCTDEFGDPDAFNFEHGVSRNQAQAMFMGATCGWHVPAADPAQYDGKGRFIDAGGESDAG